MIKTYIFDADPEEMRKRLSEWHKDLTTSGVSKELSIFTLKELYLQCGQAFGWPREYYYSMVDTATS